MVVVGGGSETVAGGGGGDEAGDVVEKQKASFVYGAHMSFWQMPLTRSPKTQRFAYVNLLANPYKSCAVVL